MHTSPPIRSLIEVAVIRLLQALLRPVPLRAASLLGAGLGAFLFHGLRMERRTTLDSLAIAFGDRLADRERLRLAARCYRHFGALIAEFLCLSRLRLDHLSPYVTLDNPELLDAALAQGKGALVVSGHLGNWELLSVGLAAHAQPYVAYVGQQHNVLADAYINAMRERMGVGTVSKQAAMRGMLRVLKAGGTLGIAADQHFSRNRHFVRFFGRIVSAAPGPASLIQHTGVPAFFGASYKVGRFRYRVRLAPLPVPPRGDDDELHLLQITQAFFDLLEGAVRRHPEQYFWMHRRWRAPPRDEDLSETNRAFLHGGAPPRDADRSGPGGGSSGGSSGGARAPIFLDRDGTLIEEVGYLQRLEQMRVLPGTADALRRAGAAGHPLVVVTNQSAVARGLISEDFARESERHLRALLAREGAAVDGYYYCPYHPQGRPPYDRDHPDRKPGAGMLTRAAQELNLSGERLRGAFMIGDKASDLETGAALGVIPVLVRTGYGRETESALPRDFAARGGRVFEDVAAALAWIIGRG